MESAPEVQASKGIRSPLWFIIGFVAVPAALIGLGRSLEAQGAMKLAGLALVMLSAVLITRAARGKAWTSFLSGLIAGCAIPILFLIVFSATFSFPE